MKVLMVGYNGANNTGAEALLLCDIEDVRAVLGPTVQITVPSIAPENLRRYVKEGPGLKIVKIPILYFRALAKLVREHDMVVLVEGSTYMDTWGSVLLWAFLWVTRCAARLGKPCIAYAVDAGTLSPINRWLVRKIASTTTLIVTRNRAAAERLASFGVSAPIRVTADNAFTFTLNPGDESWPEREWDRAREGMVGMAVVDYSLFPVVMRPWGKKQDCYKWPYYFSRSPARRSAGEQLAERYAAVADRIATQHGAPVALICMEEVDEKLARAVHARMKHREAARVFSSREHNASRMTALLRSLRLLVTCRYHAAVLSLGDRVPQIAVGHDLRLRTLYQDLGLEESLFVDARSPRMLEELNDRIDLLMDMPAGIRAAIDAGRADHLVRARQNRSFLQSALRTSPCSADGARRIA